MSSRMAIASSTASVFRKVPMRMSYRIYSQFHGKAQLCGVQLGMAHAEPVLAGDICDRPLFNKESIQRNKSHSEVTQVKEIKLSWLYRGLESRGRKNMRWPSQAPVFQNSRDFMQTAPLSPELPQYLLHQKHFHKKQALTCVSTHIVLGILYIISY